MTDSQKLIERLRNMADRQSSTDGETCRAAADEIEDLQKKLDACRAGFDRLARQIDGYSRAGKKSESWRKKT